ncbi:glucosamine-6-phosphate deaminase [Acididesulfobacillus acetoxydans]|uniref:Glucosamine-6-phosphate deaminase n=1 Tax=Acididesulfobacillus acetoxydans TaxID=1561005 RepID=A0A8S0W452_9FIRM|nr:glucosamine-6-phosphate deaminase [Acididesulfobacillus acetoxydans]CAA7602238.1 glucosamine-6-phosphate deaminase [Acididesulfobacillus acetoxydans]CEJ07544.1 Glucosamine-6-phosphate deaminase [Acididesulfobacillus acetoxydans]
MEIITVRDNQALGQTAARWVAREILTSPDSVLGLPTGGTPVGMYHYLVRLFQEGLVSFGAVRAFNLDEYVGLLPSHPQSYAAFMREHFWGKVDLAPEAAEIPRGDRTDLAAECRRYDQAIERAGGIDVQVLGLGLNGHIGFNEPSHNLEVRTHVVDLTPATIQANARFFNREAEVPRQAITMGIGTIMQARRILLLVSGDAKADILRKVLYGPVGTEVPASILQLHGDLTVLTDIKL